MKTSATSKSRPLRILTVVVAAVVSSFAMVALETQPMSVQAAGVDPNDWLAVVNAYRSQSGLPPVSNNPAWATGTQNHACWMLLNGIAHDEAPGTPGYTADGDLAGNSSNVAVSSTASTNAQGHVDLWMTGPFHAIGILRPSLTQSSYGQCASPPNPSTTPWKSAGVLDVLRGQTGSWRPSGPIVFPGNGATTSRTRFIAESPDPRTYCGWSGRTVGLPLIAMMPGGVSTAAATLTGPNGPVPTCVLTQGNTDGVASAILGADRAVVVVPDAPLVTGTYTASVTSNGGSVQWSFNVDPSAPLAPTQVAPTSTTALSGPAAFQSITPFRFADSRVGQTITRLPAGQQVRIQIAGTAGIPSDAMAVSANFTVAEPSAAGYFTAFNCSAVQPEVSTLNYTTWETVANQAVVPLDGGALCAYASTDTHLIIDINGYVAPSGRSRFVPVDPKRLLDTRSSAPLAAGARLGVAVAGPSSPAPLDATAVALNVTVTDAAAEGWVRVFPCDAAEPGVSSVNVRIGGVRANSVIVPVASDGTVCLTSNITSNVIVDITGWFGRNTGFKFIPLTPMRLADTRSFQAAINPAANARPLEAGAVLEVQVAGNRGIPADAKAATVNLVALESPVGGWLRVVPCGAWSDVSNLNYLDPAPVANGANLKLSAKGSICVTSSERTHVIVDVNGVWL